MRITYSPLCIYYKYITRSQLHCSILNNDQQTYYWMRSEHKTLPCRLVMYCEHASVTIGKSQTQIIGVGGYSLNVPRLLTKSVDNHAAESLLAGDQI